MKNIYVIGAGGIGSWITPALCMLAGNPKSVTVIDGDKLEEKNLNRQLFAEEDIGRFKAGMLAEKYGCGFVNQYYASGLLTMDKGDWIMCCVDNNKGRKEVLETVDATGCQAIFGANETLSSEAYYYRKSWKKTEQDPRVYYDLKDDGNDPRQAAIGCVEAMQNGETQRVSANIAAASHMLSLYSLWAIEAKKMKNEALQYLPYRIRQNMSSIEMIKQFKK